MLRDVIRKILNEIEFTKDDNLKKELGFRFVQKDKPKEDDRFLSKFIYTFRTPKYKYNVYIEHYNYDLFVISFRPKLNKDFFAKQQMSAELGQKYYDEYSFLTKENIPIKIFKLLIEVVRDIIKEYPYASFGYFGAPDNKTGEDTDLFNTKRVRIYNQMLSTEFNQTHVLVSKTEYSGGLLLNTEILEEYPEIEEYGVNILRRHL
jgi:hypothetical protein